MPRRVEAAGGRRAPIAEEGAAPVEETATPVEETATPVEETATPMERTTPVVEEATPVERATPAVAERSGTATSERQELVQAMVEAMGTMHRGMAATPNPFKLFMRANPPIFEGLFNPVAAQLWIGDVEKILETIRCPEEEMVTLAAYQLRGRANEWWQTTKRSRERETITWAVFRDLFFRKYFPQSLQEQKELEFMQLAQGGMSVGQYEVRFTELSRFAPELVSTEESRARRFRKGLRAEIRIPLAGHMLTTYADTVDRALMVEGELTMRDRGGVGQGRDRGGPVSTGKRPDTSQQRGFVPSKRPNFSGQSHGQGQSRMSWTTFPTCERCGRSHMGSCYRGTQACYHCGKEGHLQRDCPARRRAASQGTQFGARPAGSMSGARPAGSMPGARPAGSMPSQGNQQEQRTAGRVYTFTRQEAEASNDVVTGTILVYLNIYAYMLDD